MERESVRDFSVLETEVQKRPLYPLPSSRGTRVFSQYRGPWTHGSGLSWTGGVEVTVGEREGDGTSTFTWVGSSGTARSSASKADF